MSAFDPTTFNHWPNFIVIGPGKSGTSWLYEVFRAHPEICTSSAKETVFFDDQFGRGLRWYSKFFRKCSCEGRPHAIGEVSNTYIFSDIVPKRIFDLFPTMKLVSTLRNPIERAFSHYLFERRNAGVTGTFEDAIQQRPDLLSRGCYDNHLGPYFEMFPKDQIRVLVYDDLKSDQTQFAGQLFEFLGVGPLPENSLLDKRVLGAGQARNRAAAKLSVGAARVIRAAGFPEVVTKIKSGFVAKLLFKPIDRSEYPVMQPETRERLIDYYQADVKRLSERLDRDFTSLWLQPGATA